MKTKFTKVETINGEIVITHSTIDVTEQDFPRMGEDETFHKQRFDPFAEMREAGFKERDFS